MAESKFQVSKDVQTILDAIILTRSPYRRRLYAIYARMKFLADEMWFRKGAEHRAMQLEVRANNLLKNGMRRSVGRP